MSRQKSPLPGIGHHFHKPADPRAGKLFEIARDNGLSGRYVDLIRAVAHEAEQRLGKSLPVNATGAIAALASELGMPWNIVRAVGVIARALSLCEIENESAPP